MPNPHADRARREKVLRMRVLLTERAVFHDLPLTRTLDRMTPREREKLDLLANGPEHPASAETWEQLRVAAVRYDEASAAVPASVGETSPRPIDLDDEPGAEPFLERERRLVG